MNAERCATAGNSGTTAVKPRGSMVKDNVLSVKNKISQLCVRINRSPDSIKIIAVTKGRSVEQINEALDAGITDIGENRVQEAIIKHKQLSAARCTLRVIKWHMIGHLQANKAKDAVRIFDLIHSVDSLRIAREIDRQASRINKIQDVLIEIKTSPEEGKSGLPPGAAIAVIEEIARLKNISLQGLMTIAPIVDASEKARPYFRMLRELRDEILAHPVIPACPAGRRIPLPVLSMGMSGDFEAAIEEGANLVRLGRVIFESKKSEDRG